MYRTLALFVLTCLLAVSASAADDEKRVPAPPPADIENAVKLVRDVFKDDYAKTLPKAKLALAEKLFKQAEETADDPAARYALYLETAELAAAAGDVTLTLDALGMLRIKYSGVKAEQDEPILKTITAKAPPTESLALAHHLIRAVDDAVTSDELETADRLAALAVTAAARSKNVRASSLAAGRVKDLEAFKKDAPTIKEALKTLEKTPGDPAASLIVGKYYCFQREEWEKGIPFLAAGNDAKLKAVAEKEAGGPREAAELLAVADGWYDAGNGAAAHHKRAAMLRAFTYYTKAAPNLTGLNRTRADKRLEELEKLAELRGQLEEIWTSLRTAVRNKDTEDLTAVGGSIGRKEFRELAPSGGLLIGFNYGTRKLGTRDIVVYVQPIYMTPTGEKLGSGNGKAQAQTMTVKAKSGYAVGSLQITGGLHMEGCTVTFMKIQGKGLNPADSYAGPVMGKEAPGGHVVGDGRPAVGFHGKVLERSGVEEEAPALGLVVAGPKPKVPPKKP